MVDNVGSAFYKGVEGFQSASSQAFSAASDLAKSASNGAGSTNLNQAAVSLTEASVQAEASAKVMQTANGMLGTIIDIYV